MYKLKNLRDPIVIALIVIWCVVIRLTFIGFTTEKVTETPEAVNVSTWTSLTPLKDLEPVIHVEAEPVIDTEREEHKVSVMQSFWFTQEEAEYINVMCNNSPNPDWCVVLATHTAWHETKVGTLWVGKSKNNLHWVKWSFIDPATWERKSYFRVYDKRISSTEDWIERYRQYRHNNDCVSMIERSRYSMTNTVAWIENCEWMQSKFYN